jgi:hypothetical protein
MRIILTILTIFLIPAICFSQQKHTHVPAKKYYDPLLYHDSTKIKVNVITYVMENDSCGICHLWYKVRQNVDTFSTRRRAKYSNLKYPKPSKGRLHVEGLIKSYQNAGVTFFYDEFPEDSVKKKQ